MQKDPKRVGPDSLSSTPSQNQPGSVNGPTIISSSIRITGELSGGENLIVQGEVDGMVDLKDHQVTIGSSGRIKGNIHGKLISVEGTVEGNLFGEEKIELQQSAVVNGDMRAPRINLQEGAKFNGEIEMELGPESSGS